MGLVIVNAEQVIGNARTIVSTTLSLSLLARLQHRDKYCVDEQLGRNFPLSHRAWKSWQWWRMNGISPLLPRFLGKRKTFWARAWIFAGRVHKDSEAVRVDLPLYYIDKRKQAKWGNMGIPFWLIQTVLSTTSNRIGLRETIRTWPL